jgi:hypothetical protein
MHTMIPFIWGAGIVQLLIVAANFWIPSILDYRGNLERLTPFVRQVFVVRHNWRRARRFPAPSRLSSPSSGC